MQRTTLDTQEIKQDLIVSIDEHQNIQKPSKKKQFKKTFSDYVLGKFSRRQLYVHVYGGFVLMLFCYFMAFILYPKENGYSIFKQTYSNLGSFDSISNYRGWYFYSLLQFISFFVNFPMAFYQHYRLKLINNVISIIACIAMVMGSICQLFLGFFPASIEPLYKTIMIGDIHNNVGYTGFASCLLGYVLYSVLSVIDRTCSKNKHPILNHIKVDLILAFIIIMFLLTTTAICSWLVIYPKLKEKNPDMPNFRTASQYTVFCFTMWENFFVYSLYIFNFIFPLVIPRRTDGIVCAQKISQKVIGKRKEVELKTDLSKKYSNIFKVKNVSCVSLLEHLADYEEVSGLLSKRSVQTLTKISQGFDTDLLNSDKITLKKEIKDNDELWPWRRILYKCIE
ncbi:Conserved_hypothetical protein [Hexamita inflata]|uniref:Uncharacterized protein n=1 Tax=Hexamita inflata TaxID=28002 RepID=A0AA86PQF3_9EUKA|nr:Conserved hypothetical protein [Hexamita inflata]